MESIEITRIGPADWQALQHIGRQTFEETFAPHNSAENMRQYLDTGFSEEKLKAELSDTNSAFYFARLGTDVIGYLKLNTGAAQTELKDRQAVEIERIYVAAAFHGKKVGQALYEHALAEAAKAGAAYIWLGVWEKNERALRFYEKNGFTAFDTHLFRLGTEEQTDIMMKLAL
jgi:diamine N-acetyltransferase